jgi:SMC interacting uncharacterized protein involved in chromosome segregation
MSYATHDDLRKKADDWKVDGMRSDISSLKHEINLLKIQNDSLRSQTSSLRASLERVIVLLIERNDLNDDQIMNTLNDIRCYL